MLTDYSFPALSIFLTKQTIELPASKTRLVSFFLSFLLGGFRNFKKTKNKTIIPIKNNRLQLYFCDRTKTSLRFLYSSLYKNLFKSKKGGLEELCDPTHQSNRFFRCFFFFNTDGQRPSALERRNTNTHTN